MGLRFDPVGGGQFQAAIKAIVEAERQPIKLLETRKGREEAKMKLFQEFKGKFQGFDKTLGEFTNFKQFRELKVDLGDGAGFVSVTVDKDKAQPGTYTLQVDQLAAKTSVITNSFASPDEPNLGIGFITANLSNGESVDIYVDEDHASLKGIAALINQQAKCPIRASVVKDGSDPERPWKLIMAAKAEGADDAVKFPELYFLDGKEDIYIDDENEAQNAVIKLDGFPIEAGGNDIPDFLEGVNLHLKQARPDQPITIAITEDHQKVAGKMKGLIDQVNGILGFINQQNKVDEKTDTRSTFAGDTTLQTIEYRIRNLMHEGFPTGDINADDFHFKFLNQMGVEFDKTGTLTFKEDKFQKALESDFDGVTEAITGEYGFAAQLRHVISQYTKSGDGTLSLREQGLRERVKNIDADIARKEERLEKKTQSLVDQFSKLEGTISNMQRQGAALSAMGSGGGGGGNLLQQLMGG